MPGIYDQLTQGMLSGMQPQQQGGGMFAGPGSGGPTPLMMGAGAQGLHPQMPLTMGGTVPPGFQPQGAAPPPAAPQQGFADRFASYLNNPMVAAALGFGSNAMGKGSFKEGLAAGVGGGLAGFAGAHSLQQERKKKDPRKDMMAKLIASYGGVADQFSGPAPIVGSQPGASPAGQPPVGGGVFDSGAQRLNTYSGLY